MTIQEVYIFACKHNLLDKDIYQVINKFHSFLETSNTDVIDKDSPFSITKVHWSFEEIMELFSS